MLSTHQQYGEDVTRNLKALTFDVFTWYGIWAWLMIRDGQYKYIRYFKEGSIEELYDMENDPDELDNLAVNA